MWGRLGPRFAVEAGFLMLVAVALGFADLRPLVIVIVMAVAWLLVSLIELLASREPRLPPATVVTTTAAAAPPVAEPAPAAVLPVEAAEIPVEQPVIAADEEPVAVPTETEPVVELELAGEAPESGAPADAVAEESVAATESPPRRRWFRRRRGEVDDDSGAEPPGQVAAQAAGDVEGDASDADEPVDAALADKPADAGAPPEEPPDAVSEESLVPAEPRPRGRWFRRRRGDLEEGAGGEPPEDVAAHTARDADEHG